MKIAIVIPIHKENLTIDEKTSLLHLERYLSGYQRIVVRPLGLKISFPAFQTVEFPRENFASVSKYSKLLLTSRFYEAFSAFDYILIYQLDCLVFSKDLDVWCQLGYDYIGSPLFFKEFARKDGISRVGNGGFSLRKVQAFLNILNSNRYVGEPVSFWKELFFIQIPDLQEWPFFRRWWKKTQILRQVRNGVSSYVKNYSLNEDLFWSDRAKLFYPNFKIAPVSIALKFAFERNPRYCFEQNDHQIPFGCHAWGKWDRAFWEPYLLA